MNKKKKILVFIDWYLPGYKAGGPIRSCANLIDHLSDQFDFFVVTKNTDYLETVPYLDIKSDCWVSSPTGNCKVYYLSEKKLNVAAIRKLIRKTDFDVAYLNGIFSFYFSIIPLFFLKHSNTVVASRGMLAISALKIKGFKKWLFLWGMKRLGGYDSVKFHATNENELKEIKTIIGNDVEVKIASNLHKKRIFQLNAPIQKNRGSLRLINVARIAPEKNLLFGLQVLQKLDFDGTIELDIYGAKYDEIYWKQCEEVIEKLPENIIVTYKGVLISSDVEKEISNYHFLYLPTSGENFGHVVLESFMSQRPVIISNKTPWINLNENKLGWDLKLDVNEFQDAIINCVMMENIQYQQMVEATSEYALKIMNDKSIIDKSIQLFS